MNSKELKLDGIIDQIRNENIENIQIFLLVQSNEKDASPLAFDLYKYDKEKKDIERVVHL